MLEMEVMKAGKPSMPEYVEEAASNVAVVLGGKMKRSTGVGEKCLGCR